MTVDNVPCAVCGNRVYVDEAHAMLDVEYRATDRRGGQFVAHVGCVDELEDPEP